MGCNRMTVYTNRQNESARVVVVWDVKRMNQAYGVTTGMRSMLS